MEKTELSDWLFAEQRPYAATSASYFRFISIETGYKFFILYFGVYQG